MRIGSRCLLVWSCMLASSMVLAGGCAGDGLPVDNGSVGGGGGSGGGGSGGSSPPGGGGFDLGTPPAGDMGTPYTGNPYKPFETTSLPKGYRSSAAAIGDVTGDGRADLVLVAANVDKAPTTSEILVYPQTATGKLGMPVAYQILDGLMSQANVAIGDLNGDGRLDVVTPRRTDLAVFYQDAAGQLSPPAVLAPANANLAQISVGIADLDGDGRADLVSAGGDASIWLQTAQGLGAPQGVSCPVYAYYTVNFGDLDGDGRRDVVLGGDEVWRGCIIYQRAAGFDPGVSLAYGTLTESIAVGDLTGDGRADVVAVGGGNRPRSYVGVAAQQPDGTLAPFSWLSSYDIPGAVVVTDADEDGRADVLVVHVGWMALGLYRQTPAGGLADELLIDFAYINWGLNCMAVGDLDGDGHRDVAVVDGAIYVLHHR